MAPGIIVTKLGSLQGFKIHKPRVYVAVARIVPSGEVTVAVNVNTVSF